MAVSSSGRRLLPDSAVTKSTRKQRMLRALPCDLAFEAAAREGGALRVAGVDEVGRGALFGPVVAAAVVLPGDDVCQPLLEAGLRDSKQLEPEARTELDRMVRG